jgi:hypothetical protein
MEIQPSGAVHPFGWSNPVLYGLLALANAFFIFATLKDLQQAIIAGVSISSRFYHIEISEKVRPSGR